MERAATMDERLRYLEFVLQAAVQVQAPALTVGCLLLLLTLDDWEFIGEPALTHREDIQPKRIEI